MLNTSNDRGKRYFKVFLESVQWYKYQMSLKNNYLQKLCMFFLAKEEIILRSNTSWRSNIKMFTP